MRASCIVIHVICNALQETERLLAEIHIF
uniref:Uncharacterized protein n=1 Tax=Anguilla anguilla TaxID=7936 RepID=A0A0E9PYN1_ANGAN